MYSIIKGTSYTFFNITFQRRCWQVCPGCVLWNLHSWLISPGVQLDLPHTEYVFKSTNILGAPSVWGGQIRLPFWIRLTNSRILHPKHVFFEKTSEIKNDHKIFFEELEFFQIIFTSGFFEQFMFKEAGVRIDLPHID